MAPVLVSLGGSEQQEGEGKGCKGRICWTNCGCFSQTLAARVLPFLRSEGIFKFMSVNSTCSCPTTMLALTFPSKSSKRKSVWTDGQTDGWTCGKTWAGAAAASVAKAFKCRPLYNKLKLTLAEVCSLH